ncbi:recombinase family protein [Candidatus Saccharibacteria bacterium]|nr:recombinase family protein [Candidatus Saccharibacteria bacterium]
MQDNKLRYAVYMRKSTEEEERQALSLDSQKDRIMQRFGDLNIVAEFSESKSAFEPDKRPQFKELLYLIDTGKIDGIIAWHPDRLSRNEVDASAITWRIRQNKIKDLKFASFSFDNSAEGVMMLQMTMSQSQYFSAKLSKDVRRGMTKKVQMGGLIGKAPEGYLNKRNSLSGRGDAIVIKDPERFDHIRRAFDLYLTGEYSVAAVHKIMTEEWGYKTMKRRKIGGGAMTKSNLYNVFRNEKYAGLVRDLDDPEKFYKGDYPAMITPEEYDKVQVLLGRKGMPRLAARKQFALRGFIRCADCGHCITAQNKRKVQKNGNVHVYTYYHCTGKYKGCSQRSVYVRENDLWEQLLELLDRYDLDPEMFDWAMDAFREFMEKEVAERNNIQTAQNKAIADVQTRLDKLLDMATGGLINDTEYKAKSAKLKAELKRLHEEQADIMHRVKNWYEIVTDTFEKLTYAGKKFTEGDVGNKKDILLAIGENPVLMDGKLQITSFKWLLPVANNAKSIRAELEKVRTYSQQIQKASKEALRLKWCGWG